MKIQGSHTPNYLKTEVSKNIKSESILDLFGNKEVHNDEDEKNNVDLKKMMPAQYRHHLLQIA